MARKGGSFGFVMMLIVLVAALWLAARAWETSGAAAFDLDPASTAPAARGPSDAQESLGDLPDLGAMRDATSAHSDAVQEALAATEE